MADEVAFCDDGTFDLPLEVDGEALHLHDLDWLLAIRPRLLLLGDPGAGKTTTLRWLASRAAAAREADPARHPEPVFVPLGRWPAGQPFADFMGRYADAADVMLLMDGLNEIGPSPEARLRELAAWLDSASPAQVVLTSRPPGPDGFDVPDLARATLRELGDEQVAAIARRRLEQAADEFTAQLGGSRLTRNPYLLTALLYLFERDPAAPLPRDTGRLLGLLAETVWERGRRQDASVPPWSIALDSHLRFARELGADDDLTPAQVVEIFVGEQLPAASIAAGLLVLEGEHVRFEHDLLRAYFLAEALAGVGPDGFLAWCRANVTHWQATAVAWSGLSGQADAFLGKLHWTDAAELVGHGYVAGDEAVSRHVERAMSDLFAGGWRTFPPVLAALSRIGEPAVPPLVAGLASVSDEQARARIAYVLGQIGGDTAVAALQPMLRAPGPPRAHAWSALLSIGGDRAHQALAEWFTDADPGLRAAAATALAKVDRAAREAELVRLADDRDPRVRAAAIIALGEIGARRSAGVVARHANDQEPEVRAAVQNAFAAFGDTAGRPQIEAALADPVEEVRLAAVKAAAALGADAAAMLLPALTDTSDAVRAAAVSSMAASSSPGPSSPGPSSPGSASPDSASPGSASPGSASPGSASPGSASPGSASPGLSSPGGSSSSGAVDAVLSALAAGPSSVRTAAAAALASMGADGHEAMLAALGGDDPALWQPVADRLLRSGWTPGAGNDQVRTAVAVRAWGRCVRLGAPAVPELRRTLGKADPSRRGGIARALRALGFRPAGTDPDLFRYYAGLVDWQRQRGADAIDLAGFAGWTSAPTVDGHPLREAARLLSSEAVEGIDEGLLRATLATGDQAERMLATVVAGWTGTGHDELVDNLLRPSPDGLLSLLAVQALGEQPTDPSLLLQHASRAAAAIAATGSALGVAEAVLVSAVQAVGRTTEVTEILDEVPALALGADDRMDLLDGMWEAFGPDVSSRLGSVTIGEFLRTLADLDRQGLPAVSTLNFPLVLWEMQRRVAVLTTVMFLVGIDRQLIADVLRAFAAISPVTVRRVLDATGAWAAAEFVADVKALAAEIEQLEDLPSPGPSDPAPAWLDGPEPDNRAG